MLQLLQATVVLAAKATLPVVVMLVMGEATEATARSKVKEEEEEALAATLAMVEMAAEITTMEFLPVLAVAVVVDRIGTVVVAAAASVSLARALMVRRLPVKYQTVTEKVVLVDKTGWK
nr:hypothetical protein [Halomonas sp. 707B3]